MIKYALICDQEHGFDVWFSRGSDFDDQKAKGQLICPQCSSKDIDKAIMAPAVSTSRKKEAAEQKRVKAQKMMNEMADKIRTQIADNCDDVGEHFAEEARAIHYGEKPERGIYGRASAQEAADLVDEGVNIAPLPDVIAPKPKRDIN